jgi:hypothetical protein
MLDASISSSHASPMRRCFRSKTVSKPFAAEITILSESQYFHAFLLRAPADPIRQIQGKGKGRTAPFFPTLSGKKVLTLRGSSGLRGSRGLRTQSRPNRPITTYKIRRLLGSPQGKSWKSGGLGRGRKGRMRAPWAAHVECGGAATPLFPRPANRPMAVKRVVSQPKRRRCRRTPNIQRAPDVGGSRAQPRHRGSHRVPHGHPQTYGRGTPKSATKPKGRLCRRSPEGRSRPFSRRRRV